MNPDTMVLKLDEAVAWIGRLRREDRVETSVASAVTDLLSGAATTIRALQVGAGDDYPWEEFDPSGKAEQEAGEPTFLP